MNGARLLRRRVRFLAIVAALAMLVGACAGTDTTDTTSPSVATTEATGDTSGTTEAATETSEARPFEGQELHVQVWPGSYEQVFVDYIFSEFSELTGATVVPSTTYEFVAVAQLQQEVDSGDPQLDVTVLLPSDTIRAGKLGLVEPITEDKVPNVANLREPARALLPAGVGYLVYSYGFGVRTDIEERIGFRPECWLDLWDERLERAIVSGTTVPTYSYQQTALALQGSLLPVDTSTFEKWAELSPNIHSLHDSPAGMEDAIVRGDADIAVVFDGRVWTMADAGVPIEFVTPCEGAYANMDMFAIVKGTKNLDLAYAFVDYALGAAAQREVALNLHYGPTATSVEFAEDELGSFIYGDDWDDLHFEDSLEVAAVADEWTDRWNEWVAGL